MIKHIIEPLESIAIGLGNTRLSVGHGTPLMIATSDIGDGKSIDEVSTYISGVLFKEVKFYKDEAAPSIKLFSERCNSIYKERVEAHGSKSPVIVNISIPEHISTENDITPIVANANLLMDSKIMFPEVNKINLVSLFVSKNDSAKNERDAFIDTVSDDDLYRIWDTYLSDTSTNNVDLLNIASISYTTRENKNDIYVLKILVENLMDNIPDETIATLDEYNLKLAGLLSHINGAIGDLIKTIEKSVVEHNVILKSIPDEGSTLGYRVIISDVMYKAYVRDGGDSDVVIGAGLKRMSAYTVEELNETKEDILRVYYNSISKERLLSSTKNSDMLRKVYINTMTRYIEELLVKSTFEDPMEEVSRMVEDMTINELQDFGKVSNRLFGEIIYNQSNISFFIERIREYTENGITMDVAITETIEDLLVKYISTMITLEDK